MTKAAVIGCGNFGTALATCLQNNGIKVITTNRNATKRESLRENFTVYEDNSAAIQRCRYICLTVRPKQVQQTMENLKKDIREKLLLNFTPVPITDAINICCSPPRKESIDFLRYETRSDEAGKEFREVFEKFTLNLANCKDHTVELGELTQTFSHLTNFFTKSTAKKPHLQFVLNILDTVEETQRKAKTKEGLTANLQEVQDQVMPPHIESEETIKKDWIKSMKNLTS